MEVVKDAIVHGNEQAVKKWISTNGKSALGMMDEDGSTALHYAASENQLDIVELLLKKNANPNVKDTAGWTPFHSAASARHYPVCKILLKYDGDPSVKNNSNSSAFAYLGRAAKEDQSTQIELLKTIIEKKKVDIHTRNDLGETILHTAALRGSLDVMKCLIEHSSDVNSVNIRGENSLHYAVRSGHPEFVLFLLENGVNPHQKSTEGKTALDEAIEFKITKVSNVLSEYLQAHPAKLPWDTVPVTNNVPKKRSFHKVAMVNNNVFVFGGGVSAVQYSNQLHLFSFQNNSWALSIDSSGDKPSQIAGHSFTVVGNQVFLFGGRNAIQTSNELHQFNPSSKEWKHIRRLDTPRCYHSSILLPDGKTIMLFGGSSNKGRNEFLNSVDLINTTNGNVKTIEGSDSAPSPRMNHGATLVGNKVFVWGGKNATESFNDLFSFDIASNKWTSLPCTGAIPSARFGHCFDAVEDKIYMFGGSDKKKATNCLFRLDPEKLEWQDLTMVQAPPMSGHDSFVFEGKIYYLGWDDQFQFLVFDKNSTSGANLPAWIPDGPVQKEKTKLTAADMQLNTPSAPRTSAYKQVSKKAVMERVEKLEYFSTTLTSTVTDLIALVEAELAKDEPFAGKSVEEIQAICASIQEFCILERPPKSWTGSNSKKKDHLHTIAQEKAPFPMHHYESLAIPPKRVPPASLEKQENATAQETIIRQRNLVLNEIISTETDYVRDLAVLIGLYLRPLREEYKDILGQYEVKKLFKNAEALWDIHLRILSLLQEEEKKVPQEQQIGNIFSQMKEDLGEYNTYCANQQTSSETAEQLLKENSKFRELVEEIQQLEPCNRQEFYSFLIKPFQRICRYPLLLKELIKQTPDEWKDKEILKKAMGDIDDVVNTANETKRVNDKISATLEILAQLVIPPEFPELSQLHKCSFIYQLSGLIELDSKRGKTKKGNVHVFQEIILFTTPKNGKLNVINKFMIPNTYCAVPAVTAKTLKAPVEFTHDSSIVIFGAGSDEARQELMNAFKSAKRAV